MLAVKLTKPIQDWMLRHKSNQKLAVDSVNLPEQWWEKARKSQECKYWNLDEFDRYLWNAIAQHLSLSYNLEQTIWIYI